MCPAATAATHVINCLARQRDNVERFGDRAAVFTYETMCDAPAVAHSLEEIKHAAAGHDNLMPLFINAVDDGATLGEICNALREVFGEYGIPHDVEGTEPLARSGAVAALLRTVRLPDDDWPELDEAPAGDVGPRWRGRSEHGGRVECGPPGPGDQAAAADFTPPAAPRPSAPTRKPRG